MDPTLLILDVKEKEIGSVSAPSFPAPRNATTGFPQPRKRSKFSALKQQEQRRTVSAAREATANNPPSSSHAPDGRDGSTANESLESDERKRIDRENTARLDNMSSDEIADAQKEIFSTMSPALLQRLLKRANLDEAAAPFDPPAGTPTSDVPLEEVEKAVDGSPIPTKETQSDGKRKKAVSFAPQSSAGVPNDRPARPAPFDEDAPPAIPPSDLFPLSAQSHAIPPTAASDHKAVDGMHFPKRAAPDLDPSDPDFLETLREKYFPNLPADPSRLAWMAPVPTQDSPADRDSPYYPGQDSLAVSQLRFDFRGRLVPPRVARAIPVTKGLHHHGEAPEAAGYTVLELARLARSAVPAQRCVAFQTLGRVLYRLGRGEWGGVDSDLAQGLWRCVSEGRVMESLGEAAGVEEGRGHQGSRAYALEAIWLAEKGGWAKKWAARLRLGR